MLNNWSGQGRLTRDIELRYTASGTPVASFTLACDRDYKPKDGERETDWIDVVAWNHSAEFVEKYFKKGDMMVVNGRIQTRTYEDTDKKKRKVTEIVGTSFNFCGGKRQESDGRQSGGQYSTQGQYGGGDQYGGGVNSQYNPPRQESNPYDTKTAYDGFMNIPDGIDEELPFN